MRRKGIRADSLTTISNKRRCVVRVYRKEEGSRRHLVKNKVATRSELYSTGGRDVWAKNYRGGRGDTEEEVVT